MTTFDDEREQTFERKFALDRELAFKVAARRNALLAHWAAARMALHGAAAGDYVKGLVEKGVVHPDPQSVAARVMGDLLARGVPTSRQELDARIARFTTRARAEIVRGALR
ncbi:MAG: DUF1476 domain-containing protein [Alphaproteobacteria bacterium]|nr:DUF1476 domain-containing protein [Alphaproteobacteria bacterium]